MSDQALKSAILAELAAIAASDPDFMVWHAMVSASERAVVLDIKAEASVSGGVRVDVTVRFERDLKNGEARYEPV
jgi:hypothetical protein